MPSAISRKFRRFFVVAGLLIVALLIAPFFVDISIYKTQIEQHVEDATGRKLTIGSISASFFPWVGVELENVHLANREGFAVRDFASVESLEVKLALLPLLSKSIEVEDFEVTAPTVYLERRRDGQTNWDDLVSSDHYRADHLEEAEEAVPDSEIADATTEGDTPPAPPPAVQILAALQAESLSLSEGHVTWADGDAEPLVFSELDLELNDVQLERPVSVKLDGKLSGNHFTVDVMVGPLGDLSKINLAELSLQGSVKAKKVKLKSFRSMLPDWPELLGDIEHAHLGLSASIEQRPDGLRLGEGEVVLNSLINMKSTWQVDMAKSDTLKVHRANLMVNGREVLVARGSVKKVTTRPFFQLHVDSEPLEHDWLSGFIPGLNKLYAEHPLPWQQVKFSSLLAGNSKQLEIRDMQLLLDQELLQVSGAVVYGTPDIRLRIAANELHLDPWLPKIVEEKEVSFSDAVSLNIVSDAWASVEGGKAVDKEILEPDLRFLKPWRVTAKVQMDRLYLRGLELGNFTANINGSRGRFDLNPLRFNLAGGSVIEKARLNVAAYPARWKESAHITNVKIGPLLKAFAGMDMFEGELSMDTNLRARGLTGAAMKSLSGGGNVMVRNGKIRGFDLAGVIRKFTNPAAATGPEETDFSQLSGSFSVKKGVAKNQDLFMASPLLRVTGGGTVNLVNKTLDYHVKPRVVGTLMGQGDSAPVRRGLIVPLHISGPFESLRVKPEITASAIIENAPLLLEKGGVGKVLGSILGGNTPANQDAPADQAGEAPVVEESAERKLLRGLGAILGGSVPERQNAPVDSPVDPPADQVNEQPVAEESPEKQFLKGIGGILGF